MNRPRGPRDRDRGSVLPLVLVFMVIGSLIVIPLLSYASTVLRVNTVVVEKTQDFEEVRGGARVAIADPVDIFNRCYSAASLPVPTPAVSTTTTCRLVDEIGVIGELEIPHAAVAMQLGEAVPAEFAGASTAQPAPADGTDWWGDPLDTSCTTWCDEPLADTIWLPDLPERASTLQEATGYDMPPPRDCKVYFPGTYELPVVVTGNTYFASGVYYFEDTVTVVGGADAVVGFGLAEGCVGDIEAVLDMPPNPLPPRLNVEGLGATMIFGDAGQLVIDNTLMDDGAGNLVPNAAGRPLRFEINQRYVEDADDAGARVSIMSVNGDTDVVDPVPVPPTTVVGPLDVTDVISIPESSVRLSDGTEQPASARGLVPSVHTAEPRPPTAPENVIGEALHVDPHPGPAAIRVSWDGPIGNAEGGSTIVEYAVTAEPGTHVCTTDGALECILTGLLVGQTYDVTVVATNAEGDSDPSPPITVVTDDTTSPHLAAPQPPTNVSVVDENLYFEEAEVGWDAPADSGGAAVARYDVVTSAEYEDDITGTTALEPLANTCSTTSFRDQPAATSCVVTGLPELDTSTGLGPYPDTTWVGYRFVVTATTATTNLGLPFAPLDPLVVIGTSAESVPSSAYAAFDGPGPSTPPAPPTIPTAPVYVPDPIVDVDVSGPAPTTVDVAGYVAIPQGRLRVANNPSSGVRIVGGVVAGSYDAAGAVLAPGTGASVGFENTLLQRTIELVTRGSGRIESRMRVQINANGAEAVVNSWVVQ